MLLLKHLLVVGEQQSSVYSDWKVILKETDSKAHLPVLSSRQMFLLFTITSTLHIFFSYLLLSYILFLTGEL